MRPPIYPGRTSFPKTVDGLSAGRLARDRAIEVVGEHAPLAWRVEALNVVREVCHDSQEFTSDQVWLRLATKPPEPRAMGPVILEAASLRYCTPTGRYRQSILPQCHARPKMVWRSLIYQAPGDQNMTPTHKRSRWRECRWKLPVLAPGAHIQGRPTPRGYRKARRVEWHRPPPG